MEGQMKVRLLSVLFLGVILGFTLQTGSASAEEHDAVVSEQFYLEDEEVQEGVDEFQEDVEGGFGGEIQEGIEGFVEIDDIPAEDEKR